MKNERINISYISVNVELAVFRSFTQINKLFMCHKPIFACSFKSRVFFFRKQNTEFRCSCMYPYTGSICDSEIITTTSTTTTTTATMTTTTSTATTTNTPPTTSSVAAIENNECIENHYLNIEDNNITTPHCD